MRPHQSFNGNNSAVAFFDLTFKAADSVSEAVAEAAQNALSSQGLWTVAVKLMPSEGIVPGWLLKRFWKAEMFFYSHMSGGFPQPKCFYKSMNEVGNTGILIMNVMSDVGKDLRAGDSNRDLT